MREKRMPPPGRGLEAVPSKALLELHRAEIARLCREYHVRTLRLFISAFHGTAHPGSDLDLLVTFQVPVSLLHLVRLERALSRVLGVPVDLVTEKSLSPYLRHRVLASSEVVYEARS